jgi:hypothetical protein
MSASDLARLLALQHSGGCFPSTITRGGGRSTDWNGFVTATVLRLLRHLPAMPELELLRRGGLDCLWSCRSTEVADAFGFWPDRARPTWASTVPPDADDTAIMTVELLRHGRLDRSAALRSATRLLASCLVSAADAEALPPWVEPGSFVAWITPGARAGGPRRPNVVDCCVNANVVALLSCLELEDLSGYGAAVRTVLGGLAWAGDDPRRLRTLTPFYPSLVSLLEAVEHALDCGADLLRPAVDRLRALGADARDDAGCCSSAYGGTVWHADAVDLARAIARAMHSNRPRPDGARALSSTW